MTENELLRKKLSRSSRPIAKSIATLVLRYCNINKAVIDRRLCPRCCHLLRQVRPLACNWYYCAQFIAKPKAVCALRLAGRRGRATLTYEQYDVIHKTVSTLRVKTLSEEDRATAIGNRHKKLVKIGSVVPKIRSVSVYKHFCSRPRSVALSLIPGCSPVNYSPPPVDPGVILLLGPL